jgi:hypothetical protein
MSGEHPDDVRGEDCGEERQPAGRPTTSRPDATTGRTTALQKPAPWRKRRTATARGTHRGPE